MHKRFSSLVAVMALLALWLVPSAAFAEGQAEGAADQPMEITWQLREETSHAAQVAEEIFDVRILGNGIWNNDTEKVNLMFAAGETPEVFSAGDDQFHYRDGLTREIPLAMIQEHAPLHYQWMLDHPIALNISRSPDSDDAYIALVGVTMSTNVPLIGFWSTRADWAENVGHPIPDYYETRWKVSTETDRTWFVPANLTLDWMEELLVLYRDGDPDGNGKVDTIPASASNVIPWSFTTLFGAFGLPMYSITVGTGGVANYQDENGDLVLQPVSPRYKKFLAHLADWYAKDLIDKEFPTMSRQDQWQKDMAGISRGAVHEQLHLRGPDSGAAAQPRDPGRGRGRRERGDDAAAYRPRGLSGRAGLPGALGDQQLGLAQDPPRRERREAGQDPADLGLAPA